MPLTPGTKVGPYEITAAIGAGGMGEVYRALDTTLDRIVAIKVLPEVFAADKERAARFTREAKTLASLNHQNIAHVHGVLDLPPEGGSHKAPGIALVMEFVDGEDVAQRLARGPVPLDEAIPIAKQVADALECAHEQGIVHRDLKPANIKLRPDGAVKVLDFGLAKALSTQSELNSGSSAMMLSPTFTSPAMTQMGIILGTAAYMAPEQARGKAVDKRADIWAFGVVLFEMLSGTRAFEGSEVSDTLAFVLTKEPDWKALPADTPPAVKRLLARCLQKDRKQRLADISDARLELDDALKPHAAEPMTAAAVPPSKRWVVPAVAAASLAIGILVGAPAALKWLVPAPPPPPVTRFTVVLPEGQDFTNTGRHFLAVSRDGSKIVYVANQQLYLRYGSSFVAQPIAGTATGGVVVNPVISPDGEYVAFYGDGALRRVPMGGGAAFTLAAITNPFGAFWDDSGIYLGQMNRGIVRVPAGGGVADDVVKAADDEFLGSPQVIRNGDTLIYTSVAKSGENRFDKGNVYAYSLGTGTQTLLHQGGSDGQVLPTGHLVFSVGDVLFARHIDLETLSVTGPATPILEGVRRSAITGASMARVSANGTLIYVAGIAASDSTPRSVALLDRSGKVQPLSMKPGQYHTPRISPNGSHLAVGVGSDTDADIWIQDLPVKANLRKLTFGGRNRFPVWSPDSRKVAFQSERDGVAGIFVQDADGLTPARLLTKQDANVLLAPESWSIQGGIAITMIKEGTSSIALVSATDGKLTVFARPPSGRMLRTPAFSPDGKWVAYAELADGAPTVFIEPFPATGSKFHVAEGGGQPLWAPTSPELILNTRATALKVYRVQTTPTVSVTETGQIARGPALGSVLRWHDITPDGKQLVVLVPNSVTDTPARHVNVVVNWFRELSKTPR